MTAINDLLGFASSEFPTQLGVKLASTDLGKTAEETIAMKPFQLAILLVQKEVSTDNPSGLADAVHIQALIKSCLGDEIAINPTAVAIGNISPQVTVNIPKNFDQMTLAEAINFVNANSKDQGVQLQFMSRADVKSAIHKVGCDALFVISEVGKINTEATSNAISSFLNGDPYQSNFGGNFLLSIGMALGTQVFQFFHPFDGSKLSSSKVDSLGLNFGVAEFGVEKFEAFVWLQSAVSNVPTQLVDEIKKSSSSFLYNDAINNGFLTNQLLAQFRHAKNTLRLPSALAVDVIYRETYREKVKKNNIPEMSTAKLGFTFTDLRKFSTGFIKGGIFDKSVTQQIVDSIKTEVGNIYCSDVICLGDITIGVGNLNGTIYCKLRTQPNEGVGDCNAKLIRLSEDELVQKAVELNLLRN
jgi:hypothetical protein